MNTPPVNRRIKVETVGDFFRKRTTPLIRLKGKWLADWGVPSNQHVRVTQVGPGKLLLEVAPA